MFDPRILRVGALALLASSVLFIGCNDEDKKPNPPTDVYCEKTPNDPQCNTDVNCAQTPNDPACPQNVDCEQHPEDPACEQNVDCEETPDDPTCQQNVDCEETPEDPACQTATACVDESGQLTEQAKDAIRAVLGQESTAIAAADLPAVHVEQVTQIEGDNGPITARNYRVLTFTLDGGQPDPNAPATSKLYLDLNAGQFLAISDQDALQSDAWDIAFDLNRSSYAIMNSGYSGGYWGSWPAGLRIAAVEGVHSEADLLAVPGPELASDMVLEQWYDKETCAPLLTNWPNEHGPSLHPAKDLPQVVVGGWYSYWFDAYDGDDFPQYQGQAHVTIPEPIAYAVYDSANRHKVYTFKFLDYNSRTGEVKIGIHDQFQQNECTKELNAITGAVGISDKPSVTPEVDVYNVPGAARYEDDGNGNLTEIPLDYTILTFTLPEPNEGDSKLYLNLRDGAFLPISDQEALTEEADRDGTVHREKNEDWDIAIDLLHDNHVYVRSGQSGGYTHLDKFVAGYKPRGMMVAAVDHIVTEEDFMQLNGGDQSSPDIQFTTEDFIDITDPQCTVTQEDGMPLTTIGNRLFSTDQDQAFVIYTSGPCHAVFQFKTLNYDDATREASIGVIRAFAGICGP